METIVEAKQHLEDNKEKGVECPCCERMYKVWRKKPISTAVASMIRLHRLQGESDNYVHLDKFNVVKKDRNFNQLVNWKLVEPQKNDDENKRASGYWRLTEAGKEFVKGNLTIKKYVFTLNNKVIGYSTERVSVSGCLGKKFSYIELMTDNLNFW